MKRPALTLVLVSLTLSACGISGSTPGGYQPPAGGGAPPATGPDEPVAMTPGGGGGPRGSGGPQRVRPRRGMADVHPVAWEKARELRRGPALRVTYWSGVEPCNVLDHVDVSYGPRAITVTLHEGHEPGEADTACIELAVRKVVTIRLEEPVQGRKIVDGAA